MNSRVSRYLKWVFALAFIASMPMALAAQGAAKAAVNAPADEYASKWDIFLGYSALIPNARINGYGYAAIDYSAIGSVTRYFNKNVGLQFEGDEHVLLPETSVNGRTASQPGDDFSGASGGLAYRIPMGNITPFFHALIGVEQAGSYYQADAWGPLMTLGGGLDAQTPWFNHHLAIRLFQGDYQYLHVNFANAQGGSTSFNPQGRISAGLVFSSGSFAQPTQVTLACSASPALIFPGDPVTVTATAGGLNPKLNVVYSFSGSGVSGSGTTATVATAALAPGSYTVKCDVKEGRAGKEGLKPWEIADASTSFTVKDFEPPTINCSADPNTIQPGASSNISASGRSPQNRPLTYSYAASAGTVAGNGATAVFNSTGAASGTTNITCNVADDKGHTATANTSVNIMEPYKAPAEPPEVKQLEAHLALHSVFFQTDQPRIEKAKGGLLASQEGTLISLATDFKKYLAYKPEAHLTLTGHADVRGSVEYNQALSERRVARTKQFLVDQGVPESKIETSGLGKEQNLNAAQVKELIEQNPDLSTKERGKILHDLGVIVWAQNRRVDVTLSTTGQQSVRMYPFNAADSLTLIDQRNLTQKKAAGGAVKKPVPPVKK
jgi:outer membrane protein OmpA-like peptidoglycan-associated protein